MAISFVIPGSIHQLTGGYIYDKKITCGLKQLNCQVDIVELSGNFPFVNKEMYIPQQLFETDLTVIDGLALPAFVSYQSQSYLALIHHPLCKEKGLTFAQKEYLFSIEKTMLHKAKHIIVTSDFTRCELDKLYNIKPENISVVCPGNEEKILVPLSLKQEKIQLLCVATITQRKGHDILIKALNDIRDLPWHLTCVGSLNRDLTTVHNLKKLIEQYNLNEKVTLKGELESKELEKQYYQADIFVLASHYEGYGMALTEAVNYGLPIISTTGGAIPHVLGDNAFLVPPNNQQQLALALQQVITSSKIRSSLQEKSLKRRRSLPSWEESSAKFKHILQKECNVVF
ncbi:glycosyltransferase [Candidatus Uabimicrobium sp. HlEnr_7]|uniref:glycosyltransferase n=1 Tax=Candidatus Uabimicrobium helgolandensis TaxID=3095367 RepID=UPI003556ADA4